MGRGGRAKSSGGALRESSRGDTLDEGLPEVIRERIRSSRRSGRTPEESLRFARSLVDGIGNGLDLESIEPVAALHFLGVPTTASCNGHDDRALAFPWIDFQAPRENGEFLLESLPGWTIVQRGEGDKKSYRLNPRQIEKINDRSFDHWSYEDWSPAREDLSRFARAVLGDESDEKE